MAGNSKALILIYNEPDAKVGIAPIIHGGQPKNAGRILNEQYICKADVQNLITWPDKSFYNVNGGMALLKKRSYNNKLKHNYISELNLSMKSAPDMFLENYDWIYIKRIYESYTSDWYVLESKCCPRKLAFKDFISTKNKYWQKLEDVLNLKEHGGKLNRRLPSAQFIDSYDKTVLVNYYTGNKITVSKYKIGKRIVITKYDHAEKNVSVEIPWKENSNLSLRINGNKMHMHLNDEIDMSEIRNICLPDFYKFNLDLQNLIAYYERIKPIIDKLVENDNQSLIEEGDNNA